MYKSIDGIFFVNHFILHNTTMTELKKFELPISSTSPASCTINDSVEGDMEFTFSLVKNKEDNGSYTRYNAVDAHTIRVEISNAFRDKTVYSTDPILVGTFNGTHLLYFKFVLTPANDTDERVITIEFLIEKK